jgi:hypothetical protein
MLTTDGKPMKAGARSTLGSDRERLDSWKEIAVYLDREVRTVQRWEKREGLPVQRQFHVKGGTVWALKHEIDAWLKNRCQGASKPALQKQHSVQAVNWSSPTLLDANRSGQSSWGWSTVALDSYRLDSFLGVAESDGWLNGRKILARAQGSRTATRDIGFLSRFVACACTKSTITLLNISVSSRRIPDVFRAGCPRNAVDAGLSGE